MLKLRLAESRPDVGHTDRRGSVSALHIDHRTVGHGRT